MDRIIDTKKDIVVVYHADCSDGFSAAWVAHKKFGETAEYFGFQNGDTLISKITGKQVFFLDVVPSLGELDEVVKNNSTTIIDHHISNKEKVLKFPNSIFDIEHSGAALAWQYFNPQVESPYLIRYIEDQDLWRWKLPGSQEISAVISMTSRNFGSWDELGAIIEDEKKRKNIVEKGEALLKYQATLVSKIIDKTAVLIEFEGHKVMAANSSALTDFVAEALYVKVPPFSIVWFKKGDSIRVSLRSVRESDVDVSEIAAKYGGGGHRTAAGFLINASEALPWKVIKE